MSENGRGETDRARFWARMVAAWRRSALTQTEFCRRRGLNAVTFSGWKGRLPGSEEGGGGSEGRRSLGVGDGKTARPRTGFVELHLAEAPGRPVAAGYEIVLSHGRVIRLPGDFDPQAVSSLIKVVESC